MKSSFFSIIHRLFVVILIFIIMIPLLYFTASYLLPKVSINTDFVPYEGKDGIDIYISSNGVHTDIVMPVVTKQHDWQLVLPYYTFENVDSTYRYVSIGWGDKGFYLNTPTWDDLTLPTAARAITGLGGTAMHVTYRQEVEENDMCIKKRISPEMYGVIVSKISSSFKTDSLGKVLKIVHPGYSDYDNFYEAEGIYSLFSTCNVWTGRILRETGIEVGLWTPFESGVMNSIRP